MLIDDKQFAFINIIKMNQRESLLIKSLEDRFGAASKLFQNKEYSLAQTSFQDLIRQLQDNLKHSQCPLVLRKILSQCCLNKTLCLLQLQQKDENEREAIKALQKCIQMDGLNYWGYFNLFSLYYQNFNYSQALANLKCSLSCLYLIKAVLSKDIQNRSREKDLGKAIGLCSNNIQAALIRLIMHLNQCRWRNALNQLAIIEQVFGSNEYLSFLESNLNLLKEGKGEQKEIRKTILKTINLLQKEMTQSKLVASDESSEDGVKKIDEKFYEFNEVLHQINELGHVFGIFHYQSQAQHQHNNKKIVLISNFISNDYLQNKKEFSSNLPKENEENKDAEAEESEPNNEFRNNQSLFDYTKSNNQYIQRSKKEGICYSKKQEELSGNLLSSLQVTKNDHNGTNAQQSQGPELTNSEAFNLESVFLANMRKKEFNIRSIESQIHPLDPQQEAFYNTNIGPHHNRLLNTDEDDDLLLDSAFDKSFAGRSNLMKKDSAISKKQSRIRKKESIEHLADSKRSKLQKSKTEQRKKIYPLNEKYKYLELYLNQFQFKDSNQESVSEVYAEFQIKTHSSKAQKYSSKRQNSKLVGFKQKIEWDDSLGYIQLPEEPVGLEVIIMKTEKDKFFDTCLGKGQIEMTFSGNNKIPIYNGTRLIGMTSAKLILSEEMLVSSFKQSSLSSSHKTQSQNSIS